jgi:tetratricopeptide (TPR) repeat protein
MASSGSATNRDPAGAATGRDRNERAPGRSLQPRHLLLALAAGATFIAYAGTLGFDFVYDDRTQIVYSPFVHSWRFVPRYFTSHVWSYQYPHMLGNYYRPMFLLWLRINHALFGLNPWPWHLMCVLLHVGVTALVFGLAKRLTRDDFTAGAAALIFGLHPVHVEAVAYISALPETVKALLLLAAFLCFLRWRDSGEHTGRGWLFVSLLFYALDTLSKETALVLPLLIIAYAWILPSEVNLAAASRLRRLARALRVALPYLALTLVYLVARDLALKGLSHPVNSLALLTLVLTIPSVLFFYLKLLFWPVGLSAFYDLPYVTHPGLKNFLLPAFLVAVVALILVVWSRRASGVALAGEPGRESRAVIFASLWLAVPVVLLLNLRVFPADEVVHDRYLYLPSVGFALLVALGIRHLRVGRARWWGWPAAQVVLVVALAAGLGAATIHQSLYWSDELSLYSHAHQVAPRNNAAETSLAAVAGERKLYSACIELYQDVLSRDPNFWRANVNLAYTYYELGRLEEAAEYFRRSIASDPVDGDQYLYLGLSLLRLGHPAEAEAAVRRALLTRPGGANYHYVLGVILKTRGNLPAALAQFQAELARNPGNDHARAQIEEIRNDLGHPLPSKSRSPAPDMPR